MGKSKGDGLVNYEVIIECLKDSQGVSLKKRQIAERIIEKYPDEANEKLNKAKAKNKKGFHNLDSPAFITQVSGEIGRDLIGIIKTKDSNIKIIEKRPQEFYYSEKENDIDDETLISANVDNETDYSEDELYKFLHDYLESIGVNSKRIDDKKKTKSKKPEGHISGNWLYPDIVGMQDLRVDVDWVDEIKECASNHASKKIRFWSFEVKVSITNSDVRKYFFQALANSSWANFGYLVAHKIQGAEVLKELQILSTLHGIGYIELDPEVPTDSKVLIPARERNDIDWDTANRLAKVSKDFCDYLSAVANYKDRVYKEDWDNDAG